MTDLKIPYRVTTLPDSTFYKCTSMVTAYLPETMTSLGTGAFAGCTGMVELTIPEALTDIGPYCFYSFDSKGDSNWKYLTLNVKWKQPPILKGSICNAYKWRRIVVPRGYRAAYLAADYWNEFTQVLERNY